MTGLTTIEQLKVNYLNVKAEYDGLMNLVEPFEQLHEIEVEKMRVKMREEFDAKHEKLLTAFSDAHETFQAAEKELKAAVLSEWQRMTKADPAIRTVAPGCVVRVTRKPEITDKAEAFKFAIAQFNAGNDKFLSFDSKQFAKVGEGLILAGVASSFARMEDFPSVSLAPGAFAVKEADNE